VWLNKTIKTTGVRKMMFLRLNTVENGYFIINVEHIVELSQNGGFTEIRTSDGNAVDVYESIEDIAAKLPAVVGV